MDDESVWGRFGSFALNHLENDHPVIEGGGATHEKCCKCLVLHDRVPALFVHDDLLVELSYLLDECERVEEGAVLEDARWQWVREGSGRIDSGARSHRVVVLF